MIVNFLTAKTEVNDMNMNKLKLKFGLGLHPKLFMLSIVSDMIIVIFILPPLKIFLSYRYRILKDNCTISVSEIVILNQPDQWNKCWLWLVFKEGWP